MEVDVLGDYDVFNIRVIDVVIVFEYFVKFRVLFILVVSIVFGLFLGFVIVFIRELMGDVFRMLD